MRSIEKPTAAFFFQVKSRTGDPSDPAGPEASERVRMVFQIMSNLSRVNFTPILTRVPVVNQLISHEWQVPKPADTDTV
jgi:hypothetical protein